MIATTPAIVADIARKVVQFLLVAWGSSTRSFKIEVLVTLSGLGSLSMRLADGSLKEVWI